MKFISTEDAKRKYGLLWKYIERPKRLIHSWLIHESNEKTISRFVNKCRGEILLDGDHTVRLLGWIDIPDDDYYYLLLERREGEVKLVYSSCVGQPLRLKKSLKMFDYYRLDNVANLNFLTIEIGMDLVKKANIKLL